VTVREVTRRAGVATTAVYRHFADRTALLLAVCAQAQSAVATAMAAQLASVPRRLTGADRARARLRAVGAGYLQFAVAEPGLFRMAFFYPSDLARTASPASAGSNGLTPFQLLSEALDDLVAAGALSEQARPGAEFLAWSAVHGLATLAIDGPLRVLAPNEFALLSQRLLELVDSGLPPAEAP
jgi:AcrR family transcriptional regulator